jgi:hypothetical protein
MSSLHTMLGLPTNIGNETLPEYLNRVTGRPKPAPKPDPLDVELAENTARVKAQAAIDREEMLVRIKVKQIRTFDSRERHDLKLQHEINRRMEMAEAQLNGDHNDNQ